MRFAFCGSAGSAARSPLGTPIEAMTIAAEIANPVQIFAALPVANRKLSDSAFPVPCEVQHLSCDLICLETLQFAW